MKLLSIGNSFSDDAQRYLHGFAEAAGDDIQCWNLYIGGCSLARHWDNFTSEAPAYTLMKNGETAENGVSIPELLRRGGWDAITLQQVSQDAGVPDTYEPDLGNLVRAVRRMCPGARLFFQETWEYAHDSGHEGFRVYHNDCNEMYQQVRNAVREAADRYGMAVIPAGDAVHAAKALPEFDVGHGGVSLYRDGFHMGLGYGRYLLACVWYQTLLGKSPVGNGFAALDEPADPALLALLAGVADGLRVK